MPERWERELRKMREAEMPAGIRARAEEGPRGEGIPPVRQRIVAAAVAFALFLGAGVFAWQALRPTERGPGGDAREPALTDATVTFLASDSEFPYAELTVDGVTVRGQADNFEWRGAIVNISHPSYVDPVRLPLGSQLIIAGDADAVASLLADEMSRDPLDDIQLIDGHGYVVAEPDEYFLVFEAKWATDTVPFYFPIEVVPVEPDLGDSDAELSINAYPFEAVLSYGGQRIAVPASSGSWTTDGEGFGIETTGRGRIPEWGRLVVPAGTPLELSGNWEDWRNHLHPGDSQVASNDHGSLMFPASAGTYDWRMKASWPEGEAEFTFGVDLIEPSPREASPVPSPSIDDAPETVGTSDVLRVSCGLEGAVVLTPSVAAQPDGLHVVPIDVLDNEIIGVFSSSEPGRSWWSGSDGVDDSFVREVPPGDLAVVCHRGSGTIDFEPEQLFEFGTPAVLEDPHRYFVSYELSCPVQDDEIGLYSNATIDDPADVEVVSLLLEGLQPDDQIEPAGYPSDGDHTREHMRIVRDDAVVASLQIGVQGGGVIHGAACSSSGIRTVD